MMTDPDDEGPDEGPASGAMSFDPLADLLLGLMAIIVPVVGLLLNMPRGHVQETGVTEASAPETAGPVIVAGADGVQVEAQEAFAVDLGQILDDQRLERLLRALRDEGGQVTVRIQPDGLESAFLLESVMAQHGPAMITQYRLSSAGGGS